MAAFEAEYDLILKKAKDEYEYEPVNEYFRDGYNLYKRMESDKEDYLLFLHDLSVDPTNNLAERNGRKFKRKAAQVMSFRSMEGVSYFCDGLSVMQTLKQKGEGLYDGVPPDSIKSERQDNKTSWLSRYISKNSLICFSEFFFG